MVDNFVWHDHDGATDNIFLVCGCLTSGIFDTVHSSASMHKILPVCHFKVAVFVFVLIFMKFFHTFFCILWHVLSMKKIIY